MTIKLARLPDRTPIRLSLSLPPELARDLETYQEFYAQTYDANEPLSLLAPAMLTAFMANDRGFSAWRKAQLAGVTGVQRRADSA
ncbi:DUF2274 domain-containing protein [Allosphingosinicella indica]|uniref:DUF2274 domain-containing protein n=1 Tax=Allosphingosinicella indica TaxID=941907 RepID=A0A1X7FYN1_9SPHN|nr:DUF2274 domain-containing protein [Allosphingosinicella indica]SMF61208.1 hypothetical protein SAMN06295910_0190 [Allosphingosinicella indica]